LSWPVLIALAIGTLALKAIGPLLFAARPVPPWLAETVSALPLAIFPALVASATLSPSSGMSLDENLIPAAVVLVLLLLVRRKNMFGAAMIAGAAVTALIRFLTS
jgi:branched-subunit amino acid transport protein